MLRGELSRSLSATQEVGGFLHVIKMPLLAAAIILLLASPDAITADKPQPAPKRPYNCLLLDEQQRSKAYGNKGNQAEIDRLTKECWRDGGRP